MRNVSDFGKWVHEALRLSRNDLEKLNPAVRRRLEWLARRLSVINNPLSFAVLWSQVRIANFPSFAQFFKITI